MNAGAPGLSGLSWLRRQGLPVSGAHRAEAPAEGDTQCGTGRSVFLGQMTRVTGGSCCAAGWLCALGQHSLSVLHVLPEVTPARG